ncbi:MAG: PorP/SprF family type IX secretion system membrane protein [Bacteroidia bacterium]|nr:PorP/SprF family type IX secretion system membrane protein [Bacteroidia bacterium]
MKIRKLVITFVLVIFSISGYAQDPLFSSTLDNPLYYNPATPGIVRGHEYRLNYREQWPGIPAALRAFNFSSTHQLRNAVGLGFFVMSNIEGESRLKTDKLEACIAFPVKISRYLKISGGINVGFGQKSIDWTRIEFDDQFDKYYGKIYPTTFSFPEEFQRKYGDLSLGVAAKGALRRGRNQAKVYGSLGIAMKHVSVFPTANFIGSDIRAVPLKYIVHGNIWFLDKTLRKGIAPNFNIEDQASMTTFNFSTRIVLRPFYFNVGVRNRTFKFNLEEFDSFIFGVGYTSEVINNNVTNIGYSYDFTTSKLIGGTYGSHEISLSYSFDIDGSRQFGGRRSRRSRNDIQCPASFGGVSY